MDIGELIKGAAKNIVDVYAKKVKLIAYAIGGAFIALCMLGALFAAGDADNAEAASDSDETEGVEYIGGTSTVAWDQFLRFVEKNEGGTKTEDGKYYIVENDGGNNPTIGHGLCLYSNVDKAYYHVDEFEEYGIDSKKLADDWLNDGTAGQVEVEICDEIWENHIRKLYDGGESSNYEGGIKADYSDLGLQEYQYYALTDVKYRRGNTVGFNDAYKEKWSDSDNQYGKDTSSEAYSEDSLFSFFWDGGHSLAGVQTRKKHQWLLFKYGYFANLDEYWTESKATGSYKSINVYNDDNTVNEEKIQELQLAFETDFNLVKGNLAGNNIGGRYNPDTCTKVVGDYLGYSGNTYYTSYDDCVQPHTAYEGKNGLGIYQCTWWANGRASEYLNKQFDVHGDGGQIYGQAQGKYERGSTPKPNSLVSYSGGGAGHVAYVEAVDEVNKCYYISHAGSGISWYGIQKLGFGETPWGYTLVGFVYLDQPIE